MEKHHETYNGSQTTGFRTCSSNGNGGSKAEAMYILFLRQQLGVRQSTPNAVVLTELGELPLWLRWLKRAARLWNRLLAQPAGSLMRRALHTSITLALEAPAEKLVPALNYDGRPLTAEFVRQAVLGVERPAGAALAG